MAYEKESLVDCTIRCVYKKLAIRGASDALMLITLVGEPVDRIADSASGMYSVSCSVQCTPWVGNIE